VSFNLKKIALADSDYKDPEKLRAFIKSAGDRLSASARLNLQGIIENLEGRRDAALDCFERSSSLKGADFAPFLNFAKLAITIPDFQRAAPFATKAWDLSPKKTAEVALPLIACLLDKGRSAEALKIISKLPLAESRIRDIWFSKVSALRQERETEVALKEVSAIEATFGIDENTIRLRGDLYGHDNSLEASRLYLEALQRSELKGKINHVIRWNASLHLLRTRHYERGWEYYDSGLTPAVGTMGRSLHELFKKLDRISHTDRNKLDASKWTIATVEQGIGDQVLFLSSYSEFLTEFPKTILLTEPRMLPILRRSFPGAVFASPGLLESLVKGVLPNNGYLPIGTIFGWYRQRAEHFFLRRKPFLVIDRNRYHKLRDMLKEKAKGRPIVGISWKGGYWESQKRNKTITLCDWLPILQKDALIVNLQYGDISDDIREAKPLSDDMVFFPKLNFKEDLDDWMTIAAACDGIISISTALVHFAGASGQKVAVLMPETQGPWILGTEDSVHPVYPHVHIFRRSMDESLGELLNRVAKIVVTK